MLKNRKLIFISSGIAVFILLMVFGISSLSSAKKQAELLREQRNEIIVLKDEFLSIRQKVDAVEARKNLTNVQGVAQAVDEVFQSIGLKDRIKTLKSSGKREVKEGFEEEADISIEKVNMNELINILYKIENAPMILTVKKAVIKKSFENPELLNVTLVLSFFKAK
jgi:hypothetical protein